MNQAIKMSEVKNGPVQTWDLPPDNYYSYALALTFFKKYFADYLNVIGYDYFDQYVKADDSYRKYNVVYFADGSAMLFDFSGGMDINFFPDAGKIEKTNLNPCRERFTFSFYKTTTPEKDKYSFIPYSFGWNGTREALKTHSVYGCRKNSNCTYCTRLLQYDSWQIKEDYPW